MTKVKFFTKSFLIIFFSLFLFCFSSCSMRAEQKSLTTQLELIDSLIMQNQFTDAIKDLKKLEKYAYDSWICIGLYKRYELMGESLAAEKIVRKSLKKNSNSLELNAILSKMLINQNKIEEALDVAKILKNSSIFLLPSRNENFSVAVLEALACGLPVIASICGGIRECINEKNGLLFPVDDVEKLAQSILYAVQHLDKYDRKAIAEDCQARFSPEVIAKQLTQIFEDTIKKTKNN